MSWLGNVLVAIDQLGNALAGGRPDTTISARTGFHAENSSHVTRYYWLMMQSFIDFAFLPIDGPNHCRKAYLRDKAGYYLEGSDFMRSLLGVFIIVSCAFISIVTRVYVLIFSEAKFQDNG